MWRQSSATRVTLYVIRLKKNISLKCNSVTWFFVFLSVNTTASCTGMPYGDGRKKKVGTGTARGITPDIPV